MTFLRLAVLVLLIAGQWNSMAMAQPPDALVVATLVVEQEVMAGQISVGTVMPLRRATIGSAVDGRVVEYPLNEGDRVEKGQTLAQLLTVTIQLELKAAEAELEYRRQQYAELKNGTRPEEIEQAQARMAAADIKQKYLESRRIRTEIIHKKNQAITEDEYEEAVAAAAEATEAYRAAKAAYELAVQGPRAEQIAQASAQVAIQQAGVDRLRDRINKYTIISRFDGYVVAEHTEVGQWVNRGDMVAEVAELDEVELVVQVVERSVAFVRPGQRVRVEIPALPDRLFEGEVSTTVPQADVRARTFPVKIRVRNEISEHGPLLKAGMYGRVWLAVGEKQNAIMVPKDALVLGGPSPVVYVLTKKDSGGSLSSVTPVPVELGVAEGELIQVLGGIQAGQKVVTQGNERLRPGQSVNVARVDRVVISPSPVPSP